MNGIQLLHVLTFMRGKILYHLICLKSNARSQVRSSRGGKATIKNSAEFKQWADCDGETWPTARLLQIWSEPFMLLLISINGNQYAMDPLLLWTAKHGFWTITILHMLPTAACADHHHVCSTFYTSVSCPVLGCTHCNISRKHNDIKI